MKLNYLIVLLMYFVFSLNAQDKIKIDNRAYNHYTIEEIKQMPDSKIEKLNFLFNESFIIPEQMKNKIKKEEIDVYSYSVFRKENERVEVSLTITKEIVSKEYIILLSYKEMDEAYQKIDEKYK